MSPETAARLQDAGIVVAAETPSYLMFVRGNCVAMGGRNPQGAVSLGSAGLLTSNGLAYLVWRDGRAFLVAKQSESPADTQQVEEIRRFSEDLKAALGV